MPGGTDYLMFDNFFVVVYGFLSVLTFGSSLSSCAAFCRIWYVPRLILRCQCQPKIPSLQTIQRTWAANAKAKTLIFARDYAVSLADARFRRY